MSVAISVVCKPLEAGYNEQSSMMWSAVCSVALHVHVELCVQAPISSYWLIGDYTLKRLIVCGCNFGALYILHTSLYEQKEREISVSSRYKITSS